MATYGTYLTPSRVRVGSGSTWQAWRSQGTQYAMNTSYVFVAEFDINETFGNLSKIEFHPYSVVNSPYGQRIGYWTYSSDPTASTKPSEMRSGQHSIYNVTASNYGTNTIDATSGAYYLGFPHKVYVAFWLDSTSGGGTLYTTGGTADISVSAYDFSAEVDESVAGEDQEIICLVDNPEGKDITVTATSSNSVTLDTISVPYSELEKNKNGLGSYSIAVPCPSSWFVTAGLTSYNSMTVTLKLASNDIFHRKATCNFTVKKFTLSLNKSTISSGSTIRLITTGTKVNHHFYTTLTTTYNGKTIELKSIPGYYEENMDVHCPGSFFAGIASDSMVITVTTERPPFVSRYLKDSNGNPLAYETNSRILTATFTLTAGSGMEPIYNRSYPYANKIQPANAAAFPDAWISGITKAEVFSEWIPCGNSTISTVIVTYNGKDYAATKVSGTNNWKVTPTNAISTVPGIKIKATDSAGRSTTFTDGNFFANIVNYYPPTITVDDIYRCDERGAETDGGDHYCITAHVTHVTKEEDYYNFDNPLKKFTAGVQNGTVNDIVSDTTFILASLPDKRTAYTIVLKTQDQISDEITKSVVLPASTTSNVNKVVYGNNILLDLTQDTVGTRNMLSGVRAHNRSGTEIEGIIPRKTSRDVTSISGGWRVAAGYYADDVSLYPDNYNVMDIVEISVYKPPSKSQYDFDEAFDPTGMIIVGKFNLGHKYIENVYVSDYSCPSEITSTQVEISYTYKNRTVKCYQEVTVGGISKTLAENTWEQISSVSTRGLGAMFWNVGDKKSIVLNGKVGDYKTFSNETVELQILAFNHSDGGASSNNILWGLCKNESTNEYDILIDGMYWSNSLSDGEKAFNMNHWGADNYGGWKGCDLRYDILGSTNVKPSGYGAAPVSGRTGSDATANAATSPVANTLMAALPADFRKVLRLRTHYTNNTGGADSSADSCVTKVVDLISLLTEYEARGSSSVSNSYEKNKQARILTGTFKGYRENGLTRAGWFASPKYNSASAFASYYTSYTSYSTKTSLGLYPIFMT